MRKVWIEAALNGPWAKARRPGIPDHVDQIVAEGIACALAGACIIHAHAYDGGGPQTFDWQVMRASSRGSAPGSTSRSIRRSRWARG